MTPLRKVMCVEDDPDIRMVAHMALEAVGGLEVCLCEGGEEALKSVARFAPDLVLMDVMMPGLDGPSTFDALRRLSPPCLAPVVFLTAKAQPSEIARLKALGAVGVISKPFDPLKLASELKSLWEQTRAHGA